MIRDEQIRILKGLINHLDSKTNVEIPTKGIVVSVGNNVKELKNGDYVIYEPRHAMKIKHEEIEYLMFPESSILAKINN